MENTNNKKNKKIIRNAFLEIMILEKMGECTVEEPEDLEFKVLFSRWWVQWHKNDEVHLTQREVGRCTPDLELNFGQKRVAESWV